MLLYLIYYASNVDIYFGSTGAVHLQVIHAAICISIMFQSLHISVVHPESETLYHKLTGGIIARERP